jgi:hypothetical protein
MIGRGMSCFAGLVLAVALGGCSEDGGPGETGPGLLDLDLGPSGVDVDVIEGHYDRNGVVYGVILDTVDETHRVALSESGLVVLAVSAREESDGLAGVIDWPAMDVDEAELMLMRPVFVDLAAAARVWGGEEGRAGPPWVVPVLELPSMLVTPPATHDDDEPDPVENPSFGGTP